MGVDAGSISSSIRIKLSQLNADIIAAKTAFDNLGTEFVEKAEKYSTLGGKRYVNSLKTISAEMRNVEGAAKAGALSETQAIDRLIQLRKRELQVLQDKAVKEGTASAQTVAAIKKTETALSSLTQKQALLGTTSANSMGSFAKSVAGYTTGYAVAVQAAQAALRAMGDLISTSVKLAASRERILMEFEVLTGSVENSNKLISEMNTLAAQTPLEMANITASGKQLLSVNIPLGEIVDKIRMLGDVAMGNPEKLERLTEAFTQLKSKGVASMEQLNRFIEAGVPIMAQLEKQTGKTGNEVFKMVEQGKIGYAEVTKALEALTSEGGLMHNMMAKVALTTEGKFSTAMDNARMILAGMGKTAIPAVNQALDALNTAMNHILQNAELGQAVAVIGRVGRALGESRAVTSNDILEYYKALKAAKAIYEDIAKESPGTARGNSALQQIQTIMKELDRYKTMFSQAGAFKAEDDAAAAADRAEITAAALKAETDALLQYQRSGHVSREVTDEIYAETEALMQYSRAGHKSREATDEQYEAMQRYAKLMDSFGGHTGKAADDVAKFSNEMERLAALQERVAGYASSGLTSAFETFGESIAKGEDPMKAFFKALLNSLGDAILAEAALVEASGWWPIINPLQIAEGAALGVAGGIAKGVAANMATGGIILPKQGGVPTVQAENGYPELDLNGGPSGRAFLTEFARAIAAEIEGGKVIVVQSILDGKVIAESTTRYQDNNLVGRRR
jgi:tape measure domain-containing protein